MPGRGQLLAFRRREVREGDSGGALSGLQFLGVPRVRGAAPGSSAVLSPRAGAVGALAGQGAWIPGGPRPSRPRLTPLGIPGREGGWVEILKYCIPGVTGRADRMF